MICLLETRLTTRWSGPGIPLRTCGTNGAARFANVDPDLIMWRAGDGASPGTSARGRYAVYFLNLM
jgi:hypothetical protein